MKKSTIYGIRPESFKLMPLLRKGEKHSRQRFIAIPPVICVTVTHFQMLDQVLCLFRVVSDYDLDFMTADQTLSNLMVR